MELNTETTTHEFYLDERNFHFMGMVLVMMNYVQFVYPPEYLAAVNKQFPGLFDQLNELWESFSETGAGQQLTFSGEEIYTLYICFDLMGRLMVSEVYDELLEELKAGGPLPAEMQIINRFSLISIRPFLQAVELYALRTGTLAGLSGIKARLDLLPVLD